MNIKSRLKKVEDKTINSDIVCQCPENALATSTSTYTDPKRCRACGHIIRPGALVVKDFSEVENFDYPVKLYAGFNPDLV